MIIYLFNDNDQSDHFGADMFDSIGAKEATLKRDQAAERRRRREKKEKDRYAGQVHIQYLYNPPIGQWEGYLTIKGIACIFIFTSMILYICSFVN
jgi:hypothetical protein